MNVLKKILNTKNGVSLVEVLITSSMIGIALVGIRTLQDRSVIEIKKSRSGSGFFKALTEINLIDAEPRDVVDELVKYMGRNVSDPEDLSKRDRGICAMMTPATAALKNPAHGPDQVFMNLPKSSQNPTALKTLVNEYLASENLFDQLTTSTECADGIHAYHYCFEPKIPSVPTEEITQEDIDNLTAKSIVFYLKIIPYKAVKSTGKIDYQPLDISIVNQLNVKEVFFRIVLNKFFYSTTRKINSTTGKVTFEAGTDRLNKKFTNYFWAGRLGWCSSTGLDLNGDSQPDPLRLILAGDGNSDPFAHSVYNVSSVSPVHSYNPGSSVEISFDKLTATSTQYVDSSQINIVSNAAEQVALSCQEKMFTCRHRNDSQRIYRSSQLNISLYPPNETDFDKELFMNLEVRGSSGSGPNILTPANTTLSYSDASNVSFTLPFDKTFNFKMNDPGNSTSNNTMCRAICDHATTSDYKAYVRIFDKPTSNFLFELGDTDPSYKDNFVTCNACYKKNCAGIGLQTIGPLEDANILNSYGIPDEPMDATIPECAVDFYVTTKPGQDKLIINEVIDFETQIENPNITKMQVWDASVPGNVPNIPPSYNPPNSYNTKAKCIAGVYNRSGGILEDIKFYLKDCSETKAVLCFRSGKFDFVKSVSIDASDNVTRTIDQNITFADAFQRCYESGTEFVKKDGFHKFIDPNATDPLGGGANPPDADTIIVDLNNNFTYAGNANYFKIPNLGRQGIFIGPDAFMENRNLGDFYAVLKSKVNGTSMEDVEFWLPYVLKQQKVADAQKEIVHAIPIIQGKDSKHKYLFGFSTNGASSFKNYHNHTPPTIYSSNIPEGNVFFGILYNGTQYRGVDLINSSHPQLTTLTLPVLCWDSTNEVFKITPNLVLRANAQSACNALGAGHQYIIPTTGLGWAHAMLLVMNNHTHYPHPDPGAANPYKAVWINLALKGDDPTGINFNDANRALIGKQRVYNLIPGELFPNVATPPSGTCLTGGPGTEAFKQYYICANFDMNGVLSLSTKKTNVGFSSELVATSFCNGSTDQDGNLTGVSPTNSVALNVSNHINYIATDSIYNDFVNFASNTGAAPNCYQFKTY